MQYLPCLNGIGILHAFSCLTFICVSLIDLVKDLMRLSCLFPQFADMRKHPFGDSNVIPIYDL